MPIEFRVLGEVEAFRDGRPLVLGPARPRSVLAALLLDANRVVTIDDVIERVWGTDPPHQARASVHSYFTRLRSALEGESTIVRHGHGYMLQADMAGIDLYRFREAAALARTSDDSRTALAHFDTALGLWRGTPFSGLESAWLSNVRTTLQNARESVVLDQTDVRLRLGQHTQLVAELTAQAEGSPLDERLAAQLMLALYRSGRQADALLHFEQVRKALADQLGVDPGAALRDLHRSILDEDPHVLLPTAPGSSAPGQELPIVPRQLPSAPRSFVGREEELVALSDALEPTGTATRVAVVVGAGGLGKTSLALHWAHEHAGKFPDGQLFINLRGFDPSLEPLSAEQAMHSFLLAFHIEPQAIPDNPEARAGLYRSVLAGKRLLLVIDNARDTGQVAGLVPGSPGCSVLVTSRNRLTSLIMSHNAEQLPLELLSARDSRTLLTSRLGARRSAADAAALDELAAVCGGLPLALAIIVGRALEHPEFPMSTLVSELHEAGSTLSTLDADAEPGIRTVLSTSLAALTRDQVEAFDLLGLVPGPDVGLPAASVLMGRSYAATRTLLRELERASLLQQQTPGRFCMHDLVRLYAREHAEARLPAGDRRALLHRFAEFYVHTAVLAAELVEPDRPTIAFGSPSEGFAPIPLRDSDEAWQWFESEEDNLRAVHDLAQRSGWHEMVWQIPWATSLPYSVSGRTFEMIDSWRAAVDATEARGDLTTISLAHRMLARAVSRLGNDEEATHHARLAIEAAERSENVVDQILTLIVTAEVQCRTRRLDLAVASGSRAWELAQAQPRSLRLTLAATLAWAFTLDGAYERGREMAVTALRLCGASDGRDVRMNILDTLGYIARQTGHLEDAIDHLREARELCPPSDTFSLADILCTTGETYFQLRQPSEAERCLREALRLYREQQRAQDVLRAEAMLDRLAGKAPEPGAADWPYG